ncbi:MAG: hypothetical protein NZ529_00920 [Cytophagaceae bacterium]|nr:hypothetical protein [Cytophagaceae bacterium]MDW8455327.1 hypothetical protein [Cytophagaceae bacterium]
MISLAQHDEGLKGTFGIKNPQKEYVKYCQECKNTLQKMPPEIKYGVQGFDGYIYFIINDREWYHRLFKKKFDGIAIDIIRKQQYPCGKKNLLADSWAYKGELLKPMYLSDMNKNMYQYSDGSIAIRYAKIPENVDTSATEYNLLIIKNKYLCHYSTFYDVRGQKWQLLDMDMIPDSVDQSVSMQSTILLNKEWIFDVPFEKNKYEYNPQDVKPIHDSLRLNDFYIKKITIKAFSSIEGPTEKNIMLQQKRAESIVKALQMSQVETINAHIYASENWVEFLSDIEGSKYAYLKNLTKDAIKEKLENKEISAELEPILKKHRKAILHIQLEKKVSHLHSDSAVLRMQLENAIAEKNILKAHELQQIIFSKIRTAKWPCQTLSGIEIPKKAEYKSLLHSKALFLYTQADTSLVSLLKEFSELLKLSPKDPRIRYNFCILRLKHWAINESAEDPKQLLNDILELNKSSINKNLINRLLINYYIIYGERMYQQKKYEEKDKAVKFIYSNYASLQLTYADVLHIAEYFVAYAKYSWAENLLAMYANKIDVTEDLLFYYLNLTIIKPKLTSTAAYRSIMLNAININQVRFCNLFKPFAKGGISFQLLENDYLKNTYCENCLE